MSSTFAQNRTGVDLAAPEGTTVLAAVQEGYELSVSKCQMPTSGAVQNG